MNRENSGLLIGFVIMVALPLHAFAGLHAVEKLEGHQITIAGKTSNYPTHEECAAAALAAGVGAYKCKASTAITVTASCEDEPQPVFKLLVNAEGFTVQPGLVVELAANGVDWVPTKQEGYVKGPDWAKGTNCWVPGLIPYAGEPLSVEGPPTQEPGPLVYCHDYGSIAHPPVGKACPATALGGCYIPPNAPDVCPVEAP